MVEPLTSPTVRYFADRERVLGHPPKVSFDVVTAASTLRGVVGQRGAERWALDMLAELNPALVVEIMAAIR